MNDKKVRIGEAAKILGVTLQTCQTKVEMSPFDQSRNVIPSWFVN